jgi:hypothetical protein
MNLRSCRCHPHRRDGLIPLGWRLAGITTFVLVQPYTIHLDRIRRSLSVHQPAETIGGEREGSPRQLFGLIPLYVKELVVRVQEQPNNNKRQGERHEPVCGFLSPLRRGFILLTLGVPLLPWNCQIGKNTLPGRGEKGDWKPTEEGEQYIPWIQAPAWKLIYTGMV